MYALPIGSVIASSTNTYTITGVLGSGGFGITYSATCFVSIGAVKAKANVALKEHFIKADCQRDETTAAVTYSEPARQRVELTRKDFVSEARRLKKLSGHNPNIVAVSEVFEANNTAYYAMELLEGQSLRDYVADRGTLSESEMLSIMTPIVGAVAFLHRNRITHLDIKPQNIMIATDQNGQLRPVLIDFGLSKHYDENGDATSTINSQGYSDGYAPNEQYYGITTFSPPSDVYSLAATMFFCLTGHKLPEAYKVTPALVAAELPAMLSPALRDALIKALAISPEDRHKDAGALQRAISDETLRPDVLMPEESISEIAEAKVSFDKTPAVPNKKESGQVGTDKAPGAPNKKESGKKDKTGLIIIAMCLIGVLAYFMLKSSGGETPAANADNIAQNTAIETPEQEEQEEEQKDEEEQLNMEGLKYADDELFRIIQGDKMGFADKDGNIIIACDYNYVTSFSDGLAAVKKDEKYGFIDKNGQEVIPLKYDDVWPFSDGMAVVKKDWKYGFIDKTGKEVIPLKYDYADSFSDGLAAVKKDGKWGFIDKTGKEVIPFEYDVAGSFSDGLAWVKKDGKWGYVDKAGNFTPEKGLMA